MDNRRRMLLSGGLSADPVLENNDWETISAISKAGKAAEFWNIGDLKNISIGGVTYAAQIIGFDHDDVTDPAAYGRAKAGITFQFQKCYVTSYAKSDYNNWGNAYLRTIVNTNLYGDFTEDLKNAIVQVNKKYQMNSKNSYLGTSNDNVFLLSSFEVFGKTSNGNSLAIDGTQYSFYAAGKSKVKTDAASSTPRSWWLRTIYGDDTNKYFMLVKTNGVESFILDKTSKYYLAPAFCI